MFEQIPIRCPYCAQPQAVEPEPSDRTVEYVEDCVVCCRPIVFRVSYGDNGVDVEVRREND